MREQQHVEKPAVGMAPHPASGRPAPSYWVMCRQWSTDEAGSEDSTEIERAAGPLAALEALTAWRRAAPDASLAWVVRTSAPFPYDVPALQAEELVAAARAEAEALGLRGARRLTRALAGLTS